MNRAQVHFEVFTRRKINAPWALEMATEDRERAIAEAEELLASSQRAAIKVSKETLDPVTRGFRSIIILSKGAVETNNRRKAEEPEETAHCITPQDLYSVHARDRIGRLLDGWLHRRRVTPFELLHRPDLAEDLDASSVELRHAIQKISIPEAQAKGLSTHEVMRTFQGLIARSIERVIKDGKAKIFPDFASAGFADTVNRISEEDVERLYLLGGGIAAYMADAQAWSEKVGLILDLADQAPAAGRPRGLALTALEQPLSEIMGSRGGLADLLGADLDLGGSLAALIRLAAAGSVRALIRYDPGLAETLPPLTGPAARLADWLEREGFENLRQGLMRRVLRELLTPRRLRPKDPDGEIAILRALAMAMTAAAGKLLPLEEVQAAFIERSKTLVGGDFVETYLKDRNDPLAEAQALVRLAENVAGAVNKKAAGRWIGGAINSLHFETELRYGAETPANKLAILASLQRAVAKAGLAEAEATVLIVKLGELGGTIESDSRFLALINQANGPVLERLTFVLRLASGESAPRGPAAERAKTEALRLLRIPETRAQLVGAPKVLESVKSMMSQAGLAA